MRLLFLFLFIFVSVLSTKIKAQSWDRTYNVATMGTRAILPVGNGFVVAGANFFMRIDSLGNLLGSQTNSTNYNFLAKTSDNHILMAGEKDSMVAITKMTVAGEILYERSFPTGIRCIPSRVVEINGNYLITGTASNNLSASPPQFTQTFLLKTNSSGGLLWFKTYNKKIATESSAGYDVQLDTDNNYIIWGNRRINIDHGGQVIKVNASTGDTIWTKQMNLGNRNTFPPTPTILKGVHTSDGGYISSGEGVEGTFEYAFSKYNASHEVEWSKVINIEDEDHSYNVKTVAQTPDGGFITGGLNYAGPTLLSSIYIAKISAVGDTVWTNIIAPSSGAGIFEMISAAAVCPDGYIFSTSGSLTVRIIKTDKYGNKARNKIKGIFYIDANNNCVKDAGEQVAPFGKAIIQPGNIIASADSAGRYSLDATPGTFSVSAVGSDLWEVVCPGNAYAITFNDFDDVYTSADIALKPTKSCSRMKVDISTTLQRRCFRNNYTVNYANEGTIASPNTELELDFAPSIVPLTFSKNHTNQGHKYFISLGTVKPGEKGIIRIVDSISCASPNGATVCVTAKINPGNNCETILPTWDSSSVFIKGKCQGDTAVKFVVTNSKGKGNGDMNGPSQYRIYKDNVLTYTQNFQMAGQDSLIIVEPADGSTIRLEADQRPDHPGYSIPRMSIEGCSVLPLTANHMGHITPIPEDDRDDTIEVDCQVIIGSYDPNDKSVKPTGMTNGGYVRSTDELEYLIRFQNTGTDTAFTVKITDMISTQLDLSSFNMAGASHNYNYVIRGNVIVWTFNNILLPDSTTNLLGSNGFLKYKIRPKQSVAQGAVIENTANIYFDFNDPVTTNTTLNTINDNYYTLSVQPESKKNREYMNVLVYPNPSRGQSEVNVNREVNGIVYVYNMSGLEIMQINMTNGKATFNKAMLKNGIYLLNVYDEKGLSGSAKMIIE